MAISYVGGNVGTSVSTADTSISLTALTGGSDAAAAAGDLVIFGYHIADADNVDLDVVCNTADFIEVADLFGNGTEDSNLGVWYKFMTATPDTTVVGEGSTGGNDCALTGAVMVFRGVKTVAAGGPFDVAATTNTGTTGGAPDPASINTSGTAGIWTVIVGGTAGPGTGGPDGLTAPTNYTTDALTTASDDTSDGAIGMAYRTDPGDPEDPGAFALTAGSGSGWTAVTMALSEGAAAAAVGHMSVAIIGV